MFSFKFFYTARFVAIVILCCCLGSCASGERFDDGKVKGKLKNGLREGKWQAEYFSGEQHFEGSYKANKAVGEWTWYYDGGGVSEVSQWTDSMRSGDFITYHEAGEIKEKGQFHKDLKVGKWEWYYPSGALNGTGYFVNGAREGEFVLWHDAAAGEESKVMSISTWKGAKGTIKSYYLNGAVEYEGQFLGDKQDGIWQFFGEDGSLFREEVYRKGIKVGGG